VTVVRGWENKPFSFFLVAAIRNGRFFVPNFTILSLIFSFDGLGIHIIAIWKSDDAVLIYLVPAQLFFVNHTGTHPHSRRQRLIIICPLLILVASVPSIAVTHMG
jgi:hypothetical protein